MKIRSVEAKSFHAENVKGQHLLHDIIGLWDKHISTSQVI